MRVSDSQGCPDSSTCVELEHFDFNEYVMAWRRSRRSITCNHRLDQDRHTVGQAHMTTDSGCANRALMLDCRRERHDAVARKRRSSIAA